MGSAFLCYSQCCRKRPRHAHSVTGNFNLAIAANPTRFSIKRMSTMRPRTAKSFTVEFKNKRKSQQATPLAWGSLEVDRLQDRRKPLAAPSESAFAEVVPEERPERDFAKAAAALFIKQAAAPRPTPDALDTLQQGGQPEAPTDARNGEALTPTVEIEGKVGAGRILPDLTVTDPEHVTQQRTVRRRGSKSKGQDRSAKPRKAGPGAVRDAIFSNATPAAEVQATTEPAAIGRKTLEPMQEADALALAATTTNASPKEARRGGRGG
ncbi:MAG: hypothetical protein ABW003_29750, partial [Microvirga sp.]